MISVLRVYYYLIWSKINVFLHSKQPVYNLIGHYSLKLLLSFADNSIRSVVLLLFIRILILSLILWLAHIIHKSTVLAQRTALVTVNAALAWLITESMANCLTASERQNLNLNRIPTRSGSIVAVGNVDRATSIIDFDIVASDEANEEGTIL